MEDQSYVCSLTILSLLLEIAILLSFVLSFVLNGIIIIVFVRRRGFRAEITNRFLLNQVLSSLVSTLTLTPFAVVDHVTPSFDTETNGIFAIAMVTNATASILSQLLVALDQYMAVLDPLHYHQRISKKRCLILCIGVWCIALAVGALLGLNLSLSDKDLSDLPAFTLPYLAFVFLLPYSLLTYFYVRVFCAAHQSSQRTRRNSVCSANFDGINANNLDKSNFLEARTPSMRSEDSSAFSNLTLSVKRKISGASAIFVHREETRAASGTLLALVMVMVCWWPHFAVIALKGIHVIEDKAFSSVALLLVLFSSVVSPLLYAYRSKRVQRDIKRALGWAQPSHGYRLRSTKRMKSFSCPQLVISSPEENQKKRKFGTCTRFDLLLLSAEEVKERGSFSSGSSSGLTTNTNCTTSDNSHCDVML